MKKLPSVHVALSEAEKKMLQNAAAIDGLKLSSWLRMLGLREAASA